MKFEIPSNWNWFFLKLNKKYEFMKNLEPQDLFRETTESLFKEFNYTEEDKRAKLLNIILTERFFLEKIVENFFSKDLIEPILKETPIKGCLLKADPKKLKAVLFSNKKSDKPSFVKVSEEVFLWVSDWGNPLNWLIKLWKNQVDFVCTEVILKHFTDLYDFEKFLELPQKLDFSYLNLSSIEKLKTYFPLVEIEELLEIQENFCKKANTLLLGKKSRDSRVLSEILKEIDEKFKIIQTLENAEKILLLLKEEVLEEDLTKLAERLDKAFVKVGILTKRIWEKYRVEESSPMIYLCGAFEHASRISEKNMILFEGFTLHVIGDLYYEWGDLGKALKYYLVSTPYTKQPLELSLSKGAIYYRLGNLDLAEKVLRESLCGCKKEDPAIHYNLGLIYLKKENYNEAKYHFYKAYLLEPSNLLFRETLAQFLWDTMAYEELEEFLCSIKEHSLKEKMLLGKLCFYKKDYQRAFEILREFLNHPQRDGECSLFLAWLYLYFNKEKQAAEVLFKEARKILGKDFERILKEFNLKEVSC